MGQTYKQFWTELANAIPKLPIPLAQRFVNRAWHDIQDSRQWSFLKSNGTLYCPPVITTGTFSVSLGNPIVVANTAARTALTSLGTGPELSKRQLRFGSGATPVYSISYIDTDFTNNGILYLDMPYQSQTTSAITYRCYRCYYGPPLVEILDSNGIPTGEFLETSDFLRYDDIYNPLTRRRFILPVQPRELLNIRDPQRSITNNFPSFMFAYKSINNIPYFELWPHPTTELTYICSFQRKGLDFQSDSETLPIIIPDELLSERMLFYGCEWASKNVSRYTELKGVNWRLEMQEHKKTYSNIDSKNPGLLEIAQRNDEENYPQNTIVNALNYATYPLGYDDLFVYPNLVI